MTSLRGMAARLRPPEPIWIVVGLITVAAAALRLWSLHKVPDDPFYDAAVRSMGLSWHNFFFGAYEPGGSVSVDKPPLDLWMQVFSVKLLGFNTTFLKLPEALGGTLAVPLLFGALRRGFGNGAGLAAATVLAVLPVSVLTSRSDTMDSLMMALLVIALGLLVHAARTDRPLWIYVAGVALGLAFNVKLLEAIIAVPGLAVVAWLALSGPLRRRALHVVGGGVVLLVVSLSWLTATLLFPAHDRPFAIGSTNGSAWNAAFVFNGYDRVAGPAQITNTVSASTQKRAHALRRAHSNDDVVLDHIPINSPSPVRLFDRAGPLSGRRLGFVLVAAILLGLPALLSIGWPALRKAWQTWQTWWHPRSHAQSAGGPQAPPGTGESAEPPSSEQAALERVRRATAWGLLAWLVVGYALFSQMTRLHPRYVEAFTPAVAAAAGIGIAWACRLTPGSLMAAPRRARRSLDGREVDAPLLTLIVAVVGLALYVRYLHGMLRTVDLIALAAGIGAIAARVLADRRPFARPLALALMLVMVLALPLTVSIGIVRDSAYDSGHSGYTPTPQLNRLSAFLRKHRQGAHYELATIAATNVASLIIKDAQPVLVVTTFNGRPVLTVSQLAHEVATGRVRYALLSGRCHRGQLAFAAQCTKPGLWIRAHGTDVSFQAGQPQGSTLFALGTR